MVDETQVTESPAEVVATQEPVNPLLAKLKKRVPGETFRLPSRGIFYRGGELDDEVEDGEIVIFPMTTVEELKMKSIDMLFQGTAITETIAACVPHILKPNKLIASDVDFILTCLRKVSYGPMMPITHRCRFCPEETVKTKEYNLSITDFIERAKAISDEQADLMNITVDEVFTVKLKPCTFDEFIHLLRRTDSDFSTVEELRDWIDDTLSAIVRSVDGITDRKKIMEWLNALPRAAKEELTTRSEQINNWGVEFDFEIQCEDCGAKDNLKTSLNPTSFFTQPSSPRT